MMAQGSFDIFPADKTGTIISEDRPVDPAVLNKENASEIYFGVSNTAPAPIPKEQFELQQEIEKVLRSVHQIYDRPSAGPEELRKTQFRTYYVRLFRLAQVGLDGSNASPEISKIELAAITSELIDNEASRVKNDHLKRLGIKAIQMATPLIAIYLVMRLIPQDSHLADILRSIGIEQLAFANFMLLWVGCFIGVWLSYGIRKSVFTLKDLTLADSDHLLPVMRLLFAGTLTMIIGIIFMLDVIKISLGNYQITDISTNPTLAFLIGAFCGISELLLPATVSKQAGNIFSKVK